METAMLTVKLTTILAVELLVIATIAGALILGVYQVIKEKIRESRLLDGIPSETNPAHRPAS